MYSQFGKPWARRNGVGLSGRFPYFDELFQGMTEDISAQETCLASQLLAEIGMLTRNSPTVCMGIHVRTFKGR